MVRSIQVRVGYKIMDENSEGITNADRNLAAEHMRRALDEGVPEYGKEALARYQALLSSDDPPPGATRNDNRLPPPLLDKSA